MQDLALSAYEALRAGAQVLEADKHGDKVLRLADGNFLKLFRRKRLISSAALYPYAQRFADNTATLQRLAVPCPLIIESIASRKSPVTRCTTSRCRGTRCAR